MNVKLLVGRSLVVLGFAMMFVGTALVPSECWAGSPDCKASCNKCGNAEDQGDGTFKCLRDENGTAVNGYCSTSNSQGSSCNGCKGSCSKVVQGGENKCVCDEK